VLKITGKLHRYIENVESDYYIPFSVRFNDKLNPHVILYMISKNNSVLEVAVNNETGAVEYITLANIEKEKVKLTDNLFSIKEEILNGTPVCSLEALSEKRLVREEKDILLVVGGKFIRIIISNGAAEKYYKVTRTYIGVNKQGELCEVAMDDMSKSEMDTLRDCLHIKKA